MSRLPSRKRKVVLCLTLTVTVGLIVATVWTSRDLLSESWYLRNLRSGDVGTKRDAIERLGGLRSRKAIPELEALVRDSDELAVPALVSLVRIGPASLDALRTLLQNERERRTILDAAIPAIGDLGGDGVPTLLPLLREQPFSPRLSWVGRAILAIGDPAIDALTDLLLEGAAHNRLAYKPLYDAIAILAQLQPRPETIRALSETLLRNGDFGARRDAANALGKLGPSARDATPSLLEALADRDPNVADAAARTLSHIGLSAIPLIRLHLDGENRATRMGAIFAMGEIGSPAAVPPLVGLLKDEDWRIRLHAIKALRKIGKDAEAAVPALREQSSARHPHVRNAAGRALEAIAGNGA